MHNAGAPRPSLEELQAWARGLAGEPGPSPFYLLALPFVASYWFWGPRFMSDALDFAAWLVAYASTAGRLL